MITYKFDVKKFPDEITGSSSLTGFVEGDFEMVINGVNVFSEEEFLIAEYFLSLHEWIGNKDSSCSNFEFESMDYEEHPIIAFIYDEDEKLFHFSSVWGGPELKFNFDAIKNSYLEFMVDLREQLSKKYRYYLEL